MALTFVADHQKERCWVADFDLADMAVAKVKLGELPVGAIVTGGFVSVITAYTTAATLNVGDNITATKYVSALDLTVEGSTDIDFDGLVLESTTKDVYFKASAVDASDPAGELAIVIKYVVPGVGDFTIG